VAHPLQLYRKGRVIRATREPSSLTSRKNPAPANRLLYPLCFLRRFLFSTVFRPKNACQVPKPPNSIKQNKIEFEI
jgi:hypothetical protein